MPIVDAAEIERLGLQAGSWLAIACEQDFAGNMFEATVHVTGNSGLIDVQKKNSQGLVVASISIRPPFGRKADSVELNVVGTDVHITSISHDPNTANHYYGKDKYIWRGVAMPYPGGMIPKGAAGVYEPTNQPEVEVDYGQIRNIVQEVVHAEVQRAIDNMKAKSKAALEEAMDGGNGSAIVYNQLVNTSYTGAKNAIHERFP